MRFIIRALLVVVLACVTLVTAPVNVRANEGDESFVANEVVLQLNLATDLNAILGAYNLTLIDQFGTRPIYRMRINDSTDPREKATALQADSAQRVRFAEPNYIGQAPESRKRARWVVGDAANYGTQWAPTAIRLTEAHTVSRGAGMRVAVIDTGIDPNHPVFAGKLLPGFDFVNFDADPREEGSSANAGYGHGTHVAGLVALVAPDAKIIPIRALDIEGAGNIWVLAEALAFAVDPDGNPQTDDGAHVINLSLGTLRRTELLDIVVTAVTCDADDDDDDDDDDSIPCLAKRGAMVVSAAGNDGDTTKQYPAAEEIEGNLAVGASTVNGTLAAFSNRGPWVRVAAPGEGVISSLPGGGYGAWNGTSMAAPIVAGTAALMFARDTGKKPVDIVNEILSKSRPGCSPEMPLLDAAAALGLSSQSSTTCRVYLAQVR
jgi:subtilisin family serine protease